MSNEKTKKFLKKAEYVIFPIGYIAVALVTSLAFSRYFKDSYYMQVFVDGISMCPTLNERYQNYNEVEFGYADEHIKSMDELKRFDIAIVHYPWDSKDYKLPYIDGDNKEPDGFDPSYKVKRIIALPNDTLSIVEGRLCINGTYYDDEEHIKEEEKDIVQPLPFKRNLSNSSRASKTLKIKITNDEGITEEVNEFTLASNRFWVMGDNWERSSDCLSIIDKHEPGYDDQGIYYNNIHARLIAIEGYFMQNKYGYCSKCDKSYIYYDNDINSQYCPVHQAVHLSFKEKILEDAHYYTSPIYYI